MKYVRRTEDTGAAAAIKAAEAMRYARLSPMRRAKKARLSPMRRAKYARPSPMRGAKYVRGFDIGLYSGLRGLGQAAIWLTDMKSLKSRLIAVKPGFLTAWDTYRRLEDEFRNLPQKTEMNLPGGAKKVAILERLNATVAAIPSWYRTAAGEKKNPSKTWLARQLIRSITKSLDIQEERIPVIVEQQEIIKEKEIIKTIYVEKEPPERGQTIETPPLPLPPPAAFPTTTIVLVGIGVLAAGYMLFLTKRR